MNERSLHGRFLDLQNKKIQEARALTVPPEGRMGYGQRTTALKTYEKILLNGESLMSYVEQAYQQHPGEPVRILDYGCANNVALRQLVANNASGIAIEATGISVGDPREEEEREFDELHHIVFIDQQSAAFAPPRDMYDFVASRMTFGHLPNPLETMRKLYRSLRKGGTMWIEFSVQGSGSLANRFFDGSKSYEEAVASVQGVIGDLKTAGIDIKVDGRKMVIRKNDVKMVFPNVKVSQEVDGEGDGRYSIYSYHRES